MLNIVKFIENNLKYSKEIVIYYLFTYNFQHLGIIICNESFNVCIFQLYLYLRKTKHKYEYIHNLYILHVLCFKL